MRAASVLQGPQTFFVIDVTDAVSGEPLNSAKIGLESRPRRGDWSPFPFEPRQAGPGTFVFGGSLRAFLAKVRVGVATDFRLTVRCPGYADVTKRHRVLARDMRISDIGVNIKGIASRQKKLRGAPFEIPVTMTPPVVRLAGMVMRDGDLSAGVAGADVTLNNDATTTIQTDASGRFLFDALPLERTVQVAASKGTDDASQTHLINYRQPTNRLTLNFKTEPSN